MKFAALLAALGVMTLGLSGVMAAPVGAQGYKRVEKITYVGSAVPVPLTGSKCEGSPPPGPGVGCVWVDTSPGERFVAAAIEDAVAPVVSAELYQGHWEEGQGTTDPFSVTSWTSSCPPYFDNYDMDSVVGCSGEQQSIDWGVPHRFCTTTDERIKLLPDTNRIFVLLYPTGQRRSEQDAKCPSSTDASATSGEVTITFTRSR